MRAGKPRDGAGYRRPVIGSRVGVGVLVAGLLAAGCGSSNDPTAESVRSTSTTTPAPASPTVAVTPTTVPPPVLASRDFSATDAAFDARVQDAGLAGGMLRIAGADGTTVHEHQVGAVGGDTPLAVASSAKWLTAATFMTFVDAGAVALDDDVARWLPEFGSDPVITPRQLLTHTSGIRDHSCQSNGTALATCVQTLAMSPREFEPGTQFSYGNAPFLVVGRLVEVLGGADFATVARERLTGPLGMDATTWPGAPDAPNPAFGLRVTVDDYGRFLAMLLDRGVARGTRVLSEAAVEQLVTDQVAGFDTTHDYSVGITGIPRYCLGCWVDVESAPSVTAVVSGNGGMGYYPWVDYTTRTWGIVGVQDERGAEVAVPASQAVAAEARRAVDG